MSSHFKLDVQEMSVIIRAGKIIVECNEPARVPPSKLLIVPSDDAVGPYFFLPLPHNI